MAMRFHEFYKFIVIGFYLIAVLDWLLLIDFVVR